MLPDLVIGSISISMLGMGIVMSLIVFLYSAYRYCKDKQLDFKQLFFSLPYMFIIIYFFGKYSEYYLQTKHLLPLDASARGYIISPNGIGFHYSGVILGLCIALLIFFYKQNKNDIKNIIDMFFISSMRMVMTLGVFLVLSDQVIGQPNDSGRFAIRSLVAESKIQQYGQVYPYGLIVSFVALLSYCFTKIWIWVSGRTGSGYIGFAIFFLLLNASFSYQLYPKYLVRQFGSSVFDVKHFINILLAIICVIEYYKLGNNK